MRFCLLLACLVLSQYALAILPENVGSSQSATGYLNTAELYRGPVENYGKRHSWPDEKIETIFNKIKDLMTSGRSEVPELVEKMASTSGERSELFTLIAKLQEEDRYRKPSLIMLGEHKALAIDGHHRIRGMERLSGALSEAEKLWPHELKAILAPLGRVRADGSFVNSLTLLKAKVVTELSPKASAEDVVRELLKRHMGFWEKNEDVDLAKKFSGINAKKIDPQSLRKLAHALGMSNDAHGLAQFRSIESLPDSAMRSFVETYFKNRSLKTGNTKFWPYNEFYTTDDIRAALQKGPGGFEALRKMLGPGISITDQESLGAQAMKDLDQLVATDPELQKRLLKRTVTGKDLVRVGMERIRYLFCAASTLPVCQSYAKTLTGEKKELTTKLFLEEGLVSGGPCYLNPENHRLFKAMNDLLKE